MNTLFEPTAADELIRRIKVLSPSAHALWGKMDVAQMMAHCASAVEMAEGKVIYPRAFIGRVLGPFFKKKMMSAEPIGKDLPTQKEMVIADTRSFDAEQKELIEQIRSFALAGKQGVTPHCHPFFGMMTTEEWGLTAYKHLDHHLKQFGV